MPPARVSRRAPALAVPVLSLALFLVLGTRTAAAQPKGSKDATSNGKGDSESNTELAKPSDKAKKKNEAFAAPFLSAKLPDRLEESPAIITVYSSEFIENFGFRTLNDLLQVTPGYEPRQASWMVGTATRGVMTTSLLLLDGTSLNSHLTNVYPAGWGLDLSNYKRIEVISGPGGVLWGAHSLLGVINLISLNGADIDGARASVQLGSLGLQRYRLKAGKRWGKLDAFLSATMTFFRGANVQIEEATGSTLSYGGKFTKGRTGTTQNKQDMYLEVEGKVRYGDFTLFGRLPFSRAYYQVSQEGGLLDYNDNGFHRSDNWLTYLSYASNFFNNAISVLAKAYVYNHKRVLDNRLWSHSSTFPQGFGIYLDDGTALKIGGVAEGAWKYIGSIAGTPLENTLIVGADWWRESVSGATVSTADPLGPYKAPQSLIPNRAELIFSAYGHEELRLLDRIALSGGARANVAQSYAFEVLFSANAVGRLFGKTYLKGSLARGLRPPTMAERYGTAPFSRPRGTFLDTSGNLAMKAATSTAYQLELLSKVEKLGPVDTLTMRADFAFTQVKNIRRYEAQVIDSTLYSMDRIDWNIFSGEFRADAQFGKLLRAWAAYSYIGVGLGSRGASVDIETQHGGPQHVWAFGTNVRFLRYFSAMARCSISADIRASQIRLDPSLAAGGQSAKLDVAPRVLLSAGLFVNRIFRDLELSLVAYNMLDRRYSYYPFFNAPPRTSLATGGQIVSYPQPGANVIFSAQMSFL